MVRGILDAKPPNQRDGDVVILPEHLESVMFALPAPGGRLENPGPPGAALESQLVQWLSQAGLGEVNPFGPLNAAEDPHLSRYLIRHDVFRSIWQDSPAIVFAPAGGGKSAFRARLAYACRVEEDMRRVFAIPYLTPEPTTSLEAHLQGILRSAAQELLLRLAYRPAQFERLEDAARAAVRQALDQNDPGLLAHFLPQLERAGSVQPLVETFDLSAAHLPAPADPAQVRALCAALAKIPPALQVPPVNRRFGDFLALLFDVLGFEAVYLLVDGVDAFPETIANSAAAAAVLLPLLEQMPRWADQKVFLKLFLPIELHRLLPEELTKPAKIDKIEWTPELLVELIHARLRAATQGEFDSLDAVSAPSLRNAEAELLAEVPPLPREVLALLNQVIVEHVRRVGPVGGLEPEDIRAARDWYQAGVRPSSP